MEGLVSRLATMPKFCMQHDALHQALELCLWQGTILGQECLFVLHMMQAAVCYGLSMFKHAWHTARQ